MTNEEAIKIIKAECYVFNPLNLDRTQMVNTALDTVCKALKQEPKTGHWSRKTKVDAYDIAGVKTWGIKCQCDKCDFTTIVVEDFGYYKYCPNCGARMVESDDKK